MRRFKRWVRWRLYKWLHDPQCAVHGHPTCGCDCYRGFREWSDDA